MDFPRSFGENVRNVRFFAIGHKQDEGGGKPPSSLMNPC